MASSISNVGYVFSTLDSFQMKSDEALFIQCINGKERQFWHKWAEDYGYKHHYPIMTKHFERQYIWHCKNCKQSYYCGSEIFVKNDYETNGYQCGFVVACPTGYHKGFNCTISSFDANCDDDHMLIRKPTFNGICITNVEKIQFTKGTVRKRSKRKHTEHDNHVVEDDLSFRQTIIMSTNKPLD